MKRSLKSFVVKGLLASLILSSLPVAPISAEESSSEDSALETSENQVADESAADAQDADSTVSSSNDFSEVVDFLLEMFAPASSKLVYESKEPIENATPEGDYVARVDGYQYYVMEDFEYNFKQSFSDQTDIGGFVVLRLTIENNSDEIVYHGNIPTFRFPDFSTLITYNYLLNSEVDDLKWDSSGYMLEPGESKTGYLVYNVTPEDIKALEALPVIQLEMPGFQAEETYQAESEILPNAKINVSFDDAQDEEVASRDHLLPDAVLEDNMGTKDLLKEVQVSDAYVTAEPEDISYGFDYYQVSEFVPNAAYEEAMKEYEDGIIIINIPLEVSNHGSDDGLDLRNVSAYLVLDNTVEISTNRHWEVDPSVPSLAVGESGTYYLTFTLDGSLYKRFEGADFTLSARITDNEYRSLDLYDYAVEISDANRSE